MTDKQPFAASDTAHYKGRHSEWAILGPDGRHILRSAYGIVPASTYAFHAFADGTYEIVNGAWRSIFADAEPVPAPETPAPSGLYVATLKTLRAATGRDETPLRNLITALIDHAEGRLS